MKAYDLLILVIIKNEKQILYMECSLAKVRSIIKSECNVLLNFSPSWPFSIFQSCTVDSIINETLFIATFMSCQAHLFLIIIMA